METTWVKVGSFFVVSALVIGVLPDIVAGPQLDAQQINCSTNGWCATNAFDEAMTTALLAPNPKAAAFASHVFTMGLCPALAIFSACAPLCMTGGEKAHAAQDFLIFISLVGFAIGLDSAAKIGAKRQRPCFHYGRQSETEAWNMPNEEFVSFFSGDATLGFVAVAAGLSMAKLRRRRYASVDHPWALKVKGAVAVSPMTLVGAVGASLGALLRVAGYMHWMTDVLVGSLVGSVCGYSLPPLLLFREQRARTNPPGCDTSDDDDDGADQYMQLVESAA
jgi:membrane-associated phospholipid phosphatase